MKARGSHTCRSLSYKSTLRNHMVWSSGPAPRWRREWGRLWSFLHAFGFASESVTCYEADEGTLSLFMDPRLSPLIVGGVFLQSWHLYLVTECLRATAAWRQLMRDCMGHWSQGTQQGDCLQHGQTGDPACLAGFVFRFLETVKQRHGFHLSRTGLSVCLSCVISFERVRFPKV